MSMMRRMSKNLRKGRRKLARKRFSMKVLKFFRSHQTTTLSIPFYIVLHAVLRVYGDTHTAGIYCFAGIICTYDISVI